jgi:hypothetical protein
MAEEPMRAMLGRHATTIAEAIATAAAIVVAIAPDATVRSASAAVVGAALVVEGGTARLFGLSVIAFVLGVPLTSLTKGLAGPAGAIAIAILTLAWLVGMAVPAAVATDRSLRPAMTRVIGAFAIPYLGAMVAGYVALTGSLATLWFTSTNADPLRASIQLAFMTAGAVSACAAVREDRRRAVLARAAASPQG